MERIVNQGFIDTTDPNNVAKYQRNVMELANQTYKNGGTNNFWLVREDDYFPTNYEWLPNNKYMGYESSYLGNYADTPSLSFIEKLRKVQKESVFERFDITLPVAYRSTKHFTVNTPLEYTTEYNLVNTNRKFTILDNAQGFINSPYAYSMSYRDAYLDVTHESFKISNEAIILMSIEDYEEMKNNPNAMNILNQRRVVVYKGSLPDAINMVLTEQGVLPVKPGMGIEYPSDLNSLIENSFMSVCEQNNIQYNTPHNIGHFTSYVDRYNSDRDDALQEFVSYLNTTFNVEIPTPKYRSIDWNQYIHQIGLENFKNALNSFNEYIINQTNTIAPYYTQERQKITEEDKQIFRSTIELFKKYPMYLGGNAGVSNVINDVRAFFESPSIEIQRNAAMNIQNYINSIDLSEAQGRTL